MNEPDGAAPASSSASEPSVGQFMIVWRYDVEPDHVDEFVAAYGPDGEWAALFARSPEFIGVDLVAADQPGTFLTIDRWRTESAWHSFMTQHDADYRLVDVRLDPMTIDEQLVARGPAIGNRSQS